MCITTTPSFFDWLSFFAGGAVGSAIIQGIILVIELQKEQKEKEKIAKAFKEEINYNLLICGTIIQTIEPIHHSVFNFARFNTVWMDQYSKKNIDYSNDDSLRLNSFLNGAKNLMTQIQDIQGNQHLLSSSGRALRSFPDLAYNNNQSALKLTKELKAILRKIQNDRKDNKMYKGNIRFLITATYRDDLSKETGKS